MRPRLAQLRESWTGSSLAAECSLQQIAPYIGKLKTSIAQCLLQAYSRPGETVLDPFSGSGVVALEALLSGRHVIASDISPYAAVLTRAKLFAPPSAGEAIRRARHHIRTAKVLAARQQYKITAPSWVREFFHPRTLAEARHLASELLERREWFLLGCLLGILHHQRPGFLSYPASHLVPYLRDAKFPRTRFPGLYEYRDLEPRMIRKIIRTYRRFSLPDRTDGRVFTMGDMRRLKIACPVHLLLSSPPYMNALDYGRDNRLRLWFLGHEDYRALDQRNCQCTTEFAELMGHLAGLADCCLVERGRVVLIVGEVPRKRNPIDTAEIARTVFENTGRFGLEDYLEDPVPDVRRCRRACKGTKREWILVFKRVPL